MFLTFDVFKTTGSCDEQRRTRHAPRAMDQLDRMFAEQAARAAPPSLRRPSKYEEGDDDDDDDDEKPDVSGEKKKKKLGKNDKKLFPRLTFFCLSIAGSARLARLPYTPPPSPRRLPRRSPFDGLISFFSSSHSRATRSRGPDPEGLRGWGLLQLPAAAQARLRRRGQTAVGGDGRTDRKGVSQALARRAPGQESDAGGQGGVRQAQRREPRAQGPHPSGAYSVITHSPLDNGGNPSKQQTNKKSKYTRHE